MTGATYDPAFPGERLGLPATGRGSIGRPGRRIGALAIDWGCAVILSIAFFAYDGLATLVIFIVVQALFIPLIGGSPGHRILRLRIVGPGGGWTGLWRPVVRTVLLALVIPAVIWDRDQRGVHDRVAGTVLVRG